MGKKRSSRGAEVSRTGPETDQAGQLESSSRSESQGSPLPGTDSTGGHLVNTMCPGNKLARLEDMLRQEWFLKPPSSLSPKASYEVRKGEC